MQTFIAKSDKVIQTAIIQSIRRGLVMIIPLLMIGAFALILKSFPVDPYQAFLVRHSILITLFDAVYNATFGALSIYIVFTLSIAYGQATSISKDMLFSIALTSEACFLVLTGFLSSDFSTESLGVKGMFTGIFAAVISSVLYTKLLKNKLFFKRFYADGVNIDFHSAFRAIVPALITITIFVIFNIAVTSAFQVSNFHDLYVAFANGIFRPFGRSLFSGFLFVLISSILWFFGIHGSDVLETVSTNLFSTADGINQATAAAGNVPTEILTKTFFNAFVLMGGCGAALSLLLAILIFSKRKSNRKLSKFAAVPMIFNINEILIFGLPIVYNPIMFVPFITTPLVLFFTSYAAMYMGLVPLTMASVEWTTPIFFSGYLTTGSAAGSLLQLFNLIIGIFIYRPFVLYYDKYRQAASIKLYESLVHTLQKSEEDTLPVILTDLGDDRGVLAKSLIADLEFAIDGNDLNLFYQPQYDQSRKMVGAEALLRWKHPELGFIYPPLVIKLAEETGTLPALEEYIIRKGMQETLNLRQSLNAQFKISLNLSASTLLSSDCVPFLQEVWNDYNAVPGEICIEITEQAALLSGNNVEDILKAIHSIGYLLAIDDFSMGYTSIKYLQSNNFNLIKLDGALVKEVEHNPRCREIISSIISLSKGLDCKVLAEYVENEKIFSILTELSCPLFQGYLFSPAVPLDQLKKLIDEESTNINE